MQIRISDLTDLKTTPLSSTDFLVVDDASEAKTYKIDKNNLFSLANLSHISTLAPSPQKIILTNENGFVDKKILNIDLHEHKTATFEAKPFYSYTLDSSLTPFSVVLPLSPENGSKIFFSDWSKTSQINPITLITQAPNLILNESFLQLDVTGFSATIIFYGNNWSLL